jgi:RNA polymerase sigma-70 factor (ECF subfamily)
MKSSARSRARADADAVRDRGVVRPLRVSYTDDASLAHALAAGDPRAAAAAWDRFAPLVRGLCWQSLGPTADVDDLLQDVFMTLFRRARDVREPALLTSFVIGITVRVARAELRRRRVRRWLMLSPDGVLPDLPSSEADRATRDALASVYEILDRLDAESRLAFVLRHAQGLDVGEIARALGCSLATAKRRLAKASERVAFHAKSDPMLAAFLSERPGDGASAPEEGR